MATHDKILLKLASWCSRSERCVADVRMKLKATDLCEQDKNAIIDRLLKEHFIDEDRYCRAFVNDKSKYSRWGSLKIQYHLMKKNIPERIIIDALQTIDSDADISRLSEILVQKQKTIKGHNEWETRMKLIRFAAGRGFPMKEIEQALSNRPNYEKQQIK